LLFRLKDPILQVEVFLPPMSISGYFLFWGIIVVISSLLLWFDNDRKPA